MTKITLDEAKHLEDLTNCEQIKNLSDEEAQANALSDLDNQPIVYPPPPQLIPRPKKT